MDIAIQPPPKLQAGSRLYPPVVVSLPLKQFVKDGSGMPEIVQGYLQDGSGNIVENSGPYVASPQSINTSSSRETLGVCSEAQYAVFPDVVVESPGTYTFTVRCYDPTYGQQSWTVLDTIHSRKITVADRAVKCEEPTSNERKLLSELQASGNFGL
ncbi:hypothetical protein MN608_01732 [Microdochium nivale]|nr:hypothetical protein MN608_01732 [Microdochium nivale]